MRCIALRQFSRPRRTPSRPVTSHLRAGRILLRARNKTCGVPFSALDGASRASTQSDKFVFAVPVPNTGGSPSDVLNETSAPTCDAAGDHRLSALTTPLQGLRFLSQAPAPSFKRVAAHGFLGAISMSRSPSPGASSASNRSLNTRSGSSVSMNHPVSSAWWHPDWRR